MASELDDWTEISPGDLDAIADFVEPFGGRPRNVRQMRRDGYQGRHWKADRCKKCNRRVMIVSGPDGKDCEFSEMLYHLRLPRKVGYQKRRLFQEHSCGRVAA